MESMFISAFGLFMKPWRQWITYIMGSQMFRAFTGQRNPVLLMPEKLPPPPNRHVRYDSRILKNKVLIIGDIHGCYDELKELLEKYHDENTSLIFVGDLVNKGPKSVEVVQYVRNEVENNGALCVRGNHDDSALAKALHIKTNSDPSSFIHRLSRQDINW
eukprot:CAMPEP_0182426728 /NCGR_PEP_ID=MMETSP1167-20130531/13252_1 /TAXON_ID=2988 /ORGANISM="Mallomonas Sp, Strain CCMP3275" /LENGTH=159 /DNA_ID=CAMNT_0024608387 /DNA_START=222 /DNA_END=698 /DNA_ORIENTATION=-